MGIITLWRTSAVVRRLIVALGIAAAVALLTLLQRSAVRLLQQSSSSGGAELAKSALVDLTGVQIRTRQAGRDVVELNADRLTLFKDLHSASLVGITNGIAYRAGVPALHFSAGEADAQVFPDNLSGVLHLTGNVVADAAAGGVPLHVATNALDWRWPQGVISTAGAVHATVARLGDIECAGIRVSLPARTLTFGAVQVTAPTTVLPISAASTQTTSPHTASDSDVSLNFPGGAFLDDKTSTLTAHGPVTVKQGAVTMQAVGVVYNNNTEIAHALSPVKIVDDQSVLTGDDGTIDFRTHIATVTGNVHLSATPKQQAAASGSSGDKEVKKPTQMLCDDMTYNYRTKLADASGHMTVLQPDRTVTAGTGHYDANAQIIILHGNVDGKSTDGKHLTSPEAIVSVKQDDEWIQVKGPITYQFTVNDEDNPLPPSAKSSAPGKPDASSNVNFTSPDDGHYDDDSGVLTIKGPVTVTQGKVTMTTVGVVYNDNTKIAHALSPVKIVDDQNTLTGDDGTTNFQTHLATVTGNVHLNATPKQQSGKGGDSTDSEVKKPTQMLCDHITYNYRTKLADASGHLTILQRDRTVTADTGHYDANAQLITLHGNVDGKSTDGKHLTAPEALVSVKQDDEWLQVEGPFKAVFKINDQDNPLPPSARSSHTKKSSSPKAPPATPNSSPAAPPATPPAAAP